MEELFTRGIMRMGPSRTDPNNQVGVFNMEFAATLPALRLAEMEKFRWIEGEWNSENHVPATRTNPAYVDKNTGQYKLCEKSAWLCLVDRTGAERRHITFDPFSRQWMYVLLEGAYGIMRSPGWVENRIVFEGLVTMIGVECYLRQTWTRIDDNEFRFVNEERLADGSWAYVDEWVCRRKQNS
ncbi:MAG TPA: hypothetical protein VKU19_13835 [Bryobacteraceae bacterium]|nr:hypothetical protein [Bryobacteraceae bacterium]